MTADLARTRSAPPSDGLETPASSRTAERPRVADAARSALIWTTAQWWLVPVGIYLATRLLTAAMIVLASGEQSMSSTSLPGYHSEVSPGPDPGYAQVVTSWDGQWYWTIATHGYPSALPKGADAMVETNAWAFSPLYPATVRVLMVLAGVSFPLAAMIVSLLCSLCAILIVDRVINGVAGRFAARATVLLLCVSMASPALQIAYSEGMALMLLAAALLMLRQRRYGWVAPMIVALGLTRPILLPFIAVLLVHALVAWREGTLTRVQVAKIGGLIALCGVATALWPGIVAVATGEPMGYLATQQAWKRTMSDDSLGPALGPLGWSLGNVILLMVAGVLLTAVVRRHSARGWGPELRTWAFAYPMYFLAVAPAMLSTFRFFLLAFPLAWPFPDRVETAAGRRTRIAAAIVLSAIGLTTQWYWIRHFLVLGPISEQIGMP